MIRCSTFLKDVINDFNALWHCEEVDSSTVSVTTPYVSLNNKFVVLFVRAEKERFVVSDGGLLSGYLNSGEFGNPTPSLFNRIVDEYLVHYDVRQQTLEKAEKIKKGVNIYYYKVASEVKMLSGCIFEMADFARSFLSAIHIGSAKQMDDVQALKFDKLAKAFLKEEYAAANDHEQLQFDYKVPYGQGRYKKVDAIIYKNKKLNLVQFLSGGLVQHYQSRISRVVFDYQLMGNFDLVEQRLALYDDDSDVFRNSNVDVSEYLELLDESKVLTRPPIPWSKREEILDLIPAGL